MEKHTTKSRQQVNWLKARCACGREYEYPENGYEPKTCGNFECVQRYLHPELYKNYTEER